MVGVGVGVGVGGHGDGGDYGAVGGGDDVPEKTKCHFVIFVIFKSIVSQYTIRSGQCLAVAATDKL